MNYKKEKGITLVALVVTIVVLLILAGVSINLVLGENGLITQAKTAKAKTAEMTNDENYLVNSYVPDYIAEQVNGTSENKPSDTEKDDSSVIKIGNTTEYTVTKTGKILNWQYNEFLKETVNNITYTVEFSESLADSNVSFSNSTLVFTTVGALGSVPDMEVVVKASNGEEKTVTLTGGEIK